MMPGYIVHLGAIITCSHPPGQATPSASSPRVKVSGQPIILQTTQYAVAGCALTGTSNPPCATGQWLSASVRVKSSNAPIVLDDSQSTCAPTAQPLKIMVTQKRVKAI